MRRLGAAAAAGALVLLMAPSALAQYPPGGDAECLRVFNAQGRPDNTFRRGERFSATGNASGNRRCADPNADVTLSINPVLDTVEADGDGDYAAIGLRIPGNIALGPATLAATTRLDGEPITYTRAIKIIGDAGTAKLPATGRDIGILAGWGVAFVAAGMTLTMATRRRVLARTDGSVGLADPPLLVDEDWERSWSLGGAGTREAGPVVERAEPEPVVPEPKPVVPALELVVPAPEPVVPAPEPAAPAPVTADVGPDDRVIDLLAQAVRDLSQAEASRRDGRHEWACFASQQAADKAVRALYASYGLEAVGRSVARLLAESPSGAPERLVDEGRVLDTYLEAIRDPGVDADGVGFDRYGDIQSEQAITFGHDVVGFVEVQLRR